MYTYVHARDWRSAIELEFLAGKRSGSVTIHAHRSFVHLCAFVIFNEAYIRSFNVSRLLCSGNIFTAGFFESCNHSWTQQRLQVRGTRIKAVYSGAFDSTRLAIRSVACTMLLHTCTRTHGHAVASHAACTRVASYRVEELA